VKREKPVSSLDGFKLCNLCRYVLGTPAGEMPDIPDAEEEDGDALTPGTMMPNPVGLCALNQVDP
jgi:hypothetical protein